MGAGATEAAVAINVTVLHGGVAGCDIISVEVSFSRGEVLVQSSSVEVDRVVETAREMGRVHPPEVSVYVVVDRERVDSVHVRGITDQELCKTRRHRRNQQRRSGQCWGASGVVGCSIWHSDIQAVAVSPRKGVLADEIDIRIRSIGRWEANRFEPLSRF